MTEALPNGLVKTTSNVTQELGNLEKVRIEDIAQLWRVYTTNKAVLEENTGRRLENLFWRIWGSEKLFKNIGGSTVAKIFCYISDSSPRIWTTPVQSPLGNRNFPQLEEIPHLPRSPSPVTPLKTLSPVSDASTVRPSLTPILKSSRKGSPRKGPVSFDSATSGRELGKHARFSTDDIAPSPQDKETPTSHAVQNLGSISIDTSASEKPRRSAKSPKTTLKPRAATTAPEAVSSTPVPAPVVGFSTPSIPSTMSNYPGTSAHFISTSNSSTPMLRTNSTPSQSRPASSNVLFSKVPLSNLSSRRSSDKGKAPSNLLDIGTTSDNSSDAILSTSALMPSAIAEEEPTYAPIPLSPVLPIRQNVSSLTLSIDASRQRGEFISQDEIERRRSAMGPEEKLRSSRGGSGSARQGEGKRRGRGK